MNNNKILYPIILLLVVLTSCDYESPLDKEQYKKTLYLIGASSNLVTKELAYSSEPQEGFITVGISGSLLIDKNVEVNLESHNSIIDWYNKKFKFLATDIKYQGLASSAFEVPSYSATLKAGETYVRVPFKIKTEDMECDSLYAITFKLASSSAGYEINQKDSALIVSFNLVNNYSGNYIFKALRHELNSSDEIVASTSITIVRTLKATEENAVRFYNDQQAETVANIKKYGVVLKVDSNNNVNISGWGDFDLIGGICTYNQNTKVFNVNYKYKMDNKTYQMVGTFAYQNEDASGK
ncbi:MAG TPA: DUF4361 domain-containing protein [Bacteroides reticulotermitis]|nr:DUF4361 domain-containing protein [Bacteroides reticulotermitis]